MVIRIIRITLLILLTSNIAAAMPLSDVLKKSKDNSKKIDQLESERKSAFYSAKSVYGATDTNLEIDYTTTEDKSDSTSVMEGNERKQETSTISFSKLTGIGTSFKFGVDSKMTEVIFADDSTVPATLRPTTNPVYNASASLTVNQPILRNFWGKEIDHAFNSHSHRANSLNHMKSVVIQTNQYQTEQLYWNLIFLRQKETITRKMIKTAKSFLKQIKKREKIGRSDAVDVASAESLVLGQEKSLFETEIQSNEVNIKLSQKISPNRIISFIPVNKDLNAQNGLTNPPKDFDSALKTAFANRFDIKKIESERSSAESELRLYKEKRKPNLDLFAVISTNGLDENQSEALNGAQKTDDKLTQTFGVSFNMKLGGTENRMLAKSARQKIISKNKEQEYLYESIYQDILTSTTQASLLRKITAHQRSSISKLIAKKREEQKKLKTARSEIVAILQYDLEIQSAELSLQHAMLKERLEEAKLRFLTHSYRTNK